MSMQPGYYYVCRLKGLSDDVDVDAVAIAAPVVAVAAAVAAVVAEGRRRSNQR